MKEKKITINKVETIDSYVFLETGPIPKLSELKNGEPTRYDIPPGVELNYYFLRDKGGVDLYSVERYNKRHKELWLYWLGFRNKEQLEREKMENPERKNRHAMARIVITGLNGNGKDYNREITTIIFPSFDYCSDYDSPPKGMVILEKIDRSGSRLSNIVHFPDIRIEGVITTNYTLNTSTGE